MRFWSLDSLRIFFTVAGEALHMSKGAVSYQISKLEGELSFPLFERRHTHIRLTPQGEILWGAAKRRFGQLETVISDLRDWPDDTLFVGAHSIFISRWLGPRLSNFTKSHPDIALKVEPINTKPDLQNPILDKTVF